MPFSQNYDYASKSMLYTVAIIALITGRAFAAHDESDSSPTTASLSTVSSKSSLSASVTSQASSTTSVHAEAAAAAMAEQIPENDVSQINILTHGVQRAVYAEEMPLIEGLHCAHCDRGQSARNVLYRAMHVNDAGDMIAPCGLAYCLRCIDARENTEVNAQTQKRLCRGCSSTVRMPAQPWQASFEDDGREPVEVAGVDLSNRVNRERRQGFAELLRVCDRSCAGCQAEQNEELALFRPLHVARDGSFTQPCNHGYCAECLRQRKNSEWLEGPQLRRCIHCQTQVRMPKHLWYAKFADAVYDQQEGNESE